MRRNKQSLWKNPAFGIFVSAVCGLAIAAVSGVLFSALLLFFIKDMRLAKVFSTASLTAGAFIGGFICGKYRRRHGLAEGVVCGIVIFSLLSAVGLALHGETAGIKKLLLLAISGSTGGVYGVNSKRPDKLT